METDTTNPAAATTATIPDPTHVLVCPPEQVGDIAALAACHGAVVAALGHATTAELHLDADQIAGVSLGPIAGVAETFELVAECHYRGDLPEHADTLAGLLEVDSWDDVAAVERLELHADSRPFLDYHPAERTVSLDDGVADGVADDVSEALTANDLPVDLLPAGELVQWRLDGTEYTLAPPTLRVDDARFDLADLAAVRLDREHRRIDLGWAASDRGFLGRLLSSFGPSRPTTMQFETGGAYDRVAREFEPVAESLGVLSERSDR